MATRVVVFLDWQNVYRRCRDAFFDHGVDPHWMGQTNPLKLAELLASNGPGPDRELTEVRVYSGRPSNARDPRGYAAKRRQLAAWEKLEGVTVFARELRYPMGWPDDCQEGAKPQEKGIDVALAVDFVTMAVGGQFDVGVLFSVDTDLKPSLEYVAALNENKGPAAEVAAWKPVGVGPRSLSIAGTRLHATLLDREEYDLVKDETDYSASAKVARPRSEQIHAMAVKRGQA